MTSILVDGKPTDIDAAPITLLCHRGDVHLMPDGQVEINPEQTIARANRVSREEWDALRVDPAFLSLFRIVFPDLTLHNCALEQAGMGVRHITGMLLLLGELQPGQSPYVRFPEAFLHGAAQSRLGDLFIRLSGAGQPPPAPTA